MITKNPKNILIADDSNFFRAVLSEILIAGGHRVKVAGGGAEVIREIENNPDGVDLLLLDLQMPGVDGFEVLKRIQKTGLDHKFPVLVITGAYEQAKVLTRLRQLGAAGLLKKGAAPEQIIFHVNRLLFPEKHALNERSRVPVSMPVDFSVGSRTQTGFFLNISDTGAYLHTDAELLVGSNLHLRFSVSGDARVFDLKGVVRWGSADTADKPLFGGYGVMFTAISEEERMALKRFIDSELEKESSHVPGGKTGGKKKQ